MPVLLSALHALAHLILTATSNVVLILPFSIDFITVFITDGLNGGSEKLSNWSKVTLLEEMAKVGCKSRVFRILSL